MPQEDLDDAWSAVLCGLLEGPPDATDDDVLSPLPLSSLPPPPWPEAEIPTALDESTVLGIQPPVVKLGTTPRASSVNVTRQRLKEELARLRLEAAGLERELTRLQHRPRRRPLALESLQHRSMLWERIARRQRLERQRSERRNHELRARLEAEFRLARGLERTLLRHRRSTSGDDDQLQLRGERTSRRGTSAERPAPVGFDELLARADASYAELAGVWARTGLAGARDERADWSLHWDHERARMGLEIIDARVVPFALAATNAAIWRCLSQRTLRFVNGQYQGITACGERICATSKMTVEMGPRQAEIDMALVITRRVERERIVLVFESSAVCGGDWEVLTRLKLVERGWVVLQHATTTTTTEDDDDDEDGTPPTTTIQTVMFMAPAVVEGAAVGGPTIPPIMDTGDEFLAIILAVFNRNLESLFQAIENLLMEDLHVAPVVKACTKIESPKVGPVMGV